jgi:hypothetical protein
MRSSRLNRKSDVFSLEGRIIWGANERCFNASLHSTLCIIRAPINRGPYLLYQCSTSKVHLSLIFSVLQDLIHTIASRFPCEESLKKTSC